MKTLLEYTEPIYRGYIIRRFPHDAALETLDFLVCEVMGIEDISAILMQMNGYKAGMSVAMLPFSSIGAMKIKTSIDPHWLVEHWESLIDEKSYTIENVYIIEQ